MLDAVPDHRERRAYQVAELVCAALTMCLLRCGSRNQADQLAGKKTEINYLKIFGMRLPVMDTVHKFFEKLPSGELDKLREQLVRRLMERKVFDKWKFKGFYNLTVDGTGLYTFDYEPFEGCPYRETKNGIKWYVEVLEAKLVFANGFSISVATEWLCNQNGKFDKQDCELAAFKRLAAKVKAMFPRLAIMVTADSLYCNGPAIGLVEKCGWKYIFTFKDSCLKSLWEKVGQAQPQTCERVLGKDTDGGWLTEKTSYTKGLEYQGHALNVVEYEKHKQNTGTVERYAHLTNINVEPREAIQITRQGRMRWNIENQGFNTQKNQGFGLQHKYARKGFNAMQNYYFTIQIAHLVSQLAEKLASFQKGLAASGRTVKALVEDLVATVKKTDLSLREIHQAYLQTKQLRY